MLDVDSLSVTYGRHQAVRSVDLQVKAGELVVILGANGAGKSSLLRSIGGMQRPVAGSRVRLGGSDLLALQSHEVVTAGVALVPEGRGIFPTLSVEENLALGALPKNARKHEDQSRHQVLKLFPKLEQRLRQTAGTMSGGEQQMVAIGRALMSAPQILLLDEPSLGLSPLMCMDLFRAIAQIRDQGIGVLLVEQNAYRSLEIADRGYLLENGSIVGTGTAHALRSDPAVARAYLGQH